MKSPEMSSKISFLVGFEADPLLQVGSVIFSSARWAAHPPACQ
jgi:hypothetical protein